MQSLEYIKARLSLGTLKGRILDIPGAGITVTDDQGKVLANGFTCNLTGTHKAQPDPSRAAFNMATLKITKATSNGGRESYNITRPMRDVIENFSDVLLKGVGEDAQFERNDPYDKLLLVCLSSSTPGTEEYAPTYDKTQFVESGRWFYSGEAEVGKQAVTLAANAEVEIVREIKDEETGQTSYRLRVPRSDGSGFEFCTASWNELHTGTFHFPGRAVSIHNASKLAIAISSRYEALSTADKLSLAQDELRQHVRESQQKQVAAWGFREWNLSR